VVEWLIQLAFHARSYLGKLSYRVLLEMRSIAVCFKGSIVRVLFVDEKPSVISPVAMDDVH